MSARVRLVLASASPRRRDILAALGIDFEVSVPDVAEEAEGDPHSVARGNAERKARAVACARPAGDRVLGADTVVALDGRVLPKPRDESQAREWLELLSGREHVVVSAICLSENGRTRTAACSTAVRFRALTPDEVGWYVRGGEWRDRAGGYAIQGRGAVLVAGITGDYWTVVGLPVPALVELFGAELLAGF